MKKLNSNIFVNKRDDKIAEAIRSYSGDEKKAIIFCQCIDHANNFQTFIPESKTCHSRNNQGKKNLNDFREGKLQFIIAVNQLNEGVDVPDAEIIVFLRCTDSKTIFLQQLGRGLRKLIGKEKVIILDFVANCDRLAMVREMADKIKELAVNGSIYSNDLLHVSGEGFDFIFSDEIQDILNVIQRIKESFYGTWQEASKAAVNAKIKSSTEYVQGKGYKKDPKLPSSPPDTYKDFPGWEVFFGKTKKEYFKTWQEESAVAIKANVSSMQDYINRCRQIHPKLHVSPDGAFNDFPGWKVFLGKVKIQFYETWQDASLVAIKFKIRSIKNYLEKRKLDPRLPSNPKNYYKNFPGWKIFLGKNLSCEQASFIALNAGVKSFEDYKMRRRLIDHRLPASPLTSYRDFPGWHIFLGKQRPNWYETWQEASRAAIKHKISKSHEYMKKAKSIDPKLPSNPQHYYKDFPGWEIFLGKVTLYKTWQEASKIVVKTNFVNSIDYKNNCKKYDSRLPSWPPRYYKDFPGWDIFLGKKPKPK